MNPDPTSLDRLHDLVVPPPVPWWPLAPGWNWVLGFLLLAAIALGLQAFIDWQRNRYRREALAELARQEAVLADPARRLVAVAAIAELVKRVALTAWPRERVAGLTGPAWTEFLQLSVETKNNSSGFGELLEDGAYDPRKGAEVDPETLRQMTEGVRHWLIHHRVEDTEGRVASC